MIKFTFREKKVIKPRKFAEPTRAQVQRAKETWKRLAPKRAKGLLK